MIIDPDDILTKLEKMRVKSIENKDLDRISTIIEYSNEAHEIIENIDKTNDQLFKLDEKVRSLELEVALKSVSIGDEVMWNEIHSHDGSIIGKDVGIVLDKSKKCFTILSPTKGVVFVAATSCTKTGRHFDHADELKDLMLS